MLRLYAYGDWDEEHQLGEHAWTYPSLRLHANVTQDGKVAIRLRLVTAWQTNAVNPDQLSIQRPPQYLRLDQRASVAPAGEVMPDVVGTTQDAWVQGILQHFGTSSVDYDLNKDGIVDSHDLLYLLNECKTVDDSVICP